MACRGAHTSPPLAVNPQRSVCRLRKLGLLELLPLHMCHTPLCTLAQVSCDTQTNLEFHMLTDRRRWCYPSCEKVLYLHIIDSSASPPHTYSNISWLSSNKCQHLQSTTNPPESDPPSYFLFRQHLCPQAPQMMEPSALSPALIAPNIPIPIK